MGLISPLRPHYPGGRGRSLCFCFAAARRRGLLSFWLEKELDRARALFVCRQRGRAHFLFQAARAGGVALELGVGERERLVKEIAGECGRCRDALT
jgi:hypothetical protein